MSQRTCAADGCDQPPPTPRAHYCSDPCQWRTWRTRRTAARLHEKKRRRARAKAASAHTCIICDHTFQATKPDSRYCSEACVGFGNALAYTDGPLATELDWRQCPQCSRWTPRGTDPYCSQVCRTHSLKSPLRIAIETGDTEQILREVRARTSTNSRGCQEWTGRLSTSGYPTYSYRLAGQRRYLQVHRIVAEAIYGPLNDQPVHHACANPPCVRPEHLQPTTHRDNNAEMMDRNWYEHRIGELEAALRQVAPDHPAIRHLRVA